MKITNPPDQASNTAEKLVSSMGKPAREETVSILRIDLVSLINKL